MKVQIALHTALESYAPGGRRGAFPLDLAEGAVVRDALARLGIPAREDSLIFVRNHRVVEGDVALADGDRLDIIPAISGG